MEIVNQGSTYVLGLTFSDENGNGVTPTEARYRIDVEGGNAITGNNTTAWVAFSPSGNTYDLVITANQNAMNNNSNNREERIVTVEFSYGNNNANKNPQEYRYMLTRLDNLLKT
jgi:hypothetical protein